METLNHQYKVNLSGESGPPSGEPEKVLAWEMIEEGRYRPRRIRGSLLGRDLG